MNSNSGPNITPLYETMTYQTDQQELLQKIRNAFGDIVYPVEARNKSYEEIDVFRHRGRWAGHFWWMIPDETIVANYAALSFAEKHLYRWLIPKYMSYTVEHFYAEEVETVTACALYDICSFAPGDYEQIETPSSEVNRQEYEERRAFEIERRSLLTQDQKRVFKDFLLFSLVYTGIGSFYPCMDSYVYIEDKDYHAKLIRYAIKNDIYLL